MRDFVLRSHIKVAFDAAIGLLPVSGPLAGFRAELADLRDDYPNSRPRVAVVGRGGVGKSTLANALLGEDLLPAAGRGATATVIWLRHAAEPEFAVCYADGSSRASDADEFTRIASARPGERPDAGPVAYLMAGDKNPFLAQFDLIDTPSLDEPATTCFLRQVRIDALIPVIDHGRVAADIETLLRDFLRIGVQAEIPSPLNSLGVLAIDSLETDDEDGEGGYERLTAVAAEVAGELLAANGARRLLYDVRPLAIGIAAAAHSLPASAVAQLRQLASGADLAHLIALAADRDDFRDADLPGIDVPAESRAVLHDQLGQHGIEVACRLLAGGADEAALRQGLADRSGLTAFTDLLGSQLAERADLVRAHAVIAKVSALAALLRNDQDADLTGSEHATLDSVAGLFRNQTTSAWNRHTVVSDCRSGRLSLSERDLADALRLLGQPGQSARDRLGVTAATPAAEVTESARKEWDHWARLDGIPFDGDTRRACRMVLRACEKLVAQTRQG